MFCALCSLYGNVVAVRLAFNVEDQMWAQQEVKVYSRLQCLQGKSVPRLRAHGFTHKGQVYFVATDYIAVSSPLLLPRRAMESTCFPSSMPGFSMDLTCKIYRSVCLVQGSKWDWNSRAHLALSSQLLDALAKVHNLGVLHGDLHAGNILVAPGGKIFILDFNGSQMQVAPEWLSEEQNTWAGFLSKQVKTV